MMKLLVEYGKLGPMRFCSHRDFVRCFERALLRAKIPMAYSSGFSPHPRISYVNPAPTGAESIAEYCVIGLRETCDPAFVRTKLDAAMPNGLPILEVTEASDLHFDASLWEVRLVPFAAQPVGAGRESGSETFQTPDSRPVLDLATTVETFLASPEAIVSRETKNGLRTFDAKPAVEYLAVTAPGTLTMVIRHTEPLVRPDDVVSALRSINPEIPPSPLTKRLRQAPAAELIPRMKQ